MNTKEKAQAIYQQFIGLTPFGWQHEKSKKCATIVVDEILTAEATVYGEEVSVRKLFIEYWEEVKQEIENL